MTEDDPRHGTYAGEYVHKRAGESLCEPCRLARNRYALERYKDKVLGRRRTYPRRGFQRRVEALQALGWSLDHIAERLGTTVGGVRHSAFAATFVTANRFIAMAKLYEELAMKQPTDSRANRRRGIARRKGYAPPLAWDDIDRDAAPNLGEKTRPNMLEEYFHLMSMGESHEQAAKQLGVTLGAIDKALIRHKKEAA